MPFLSGVPPPRKNPGSAPAVHHCGRCSCSQKVSLLGSGLYLAKPQVEEFYPEKTRILSKTLLHLKMSGNIQGRSK